VDAIRGSAQAVDVLPFGGSCIPPLPPLPDSSDDEDDAPALHLTSGDYAEEATVIELTALIVA
jgi:hypothetical protein